MIPTPTQKQQAALDVFQDLATDPMLAVLDTETTSLTGEVIELGIVDAWGRTLFNARMRPSCPVTAKAQEIHGISDADLADLPTLAYFWPKLREVLRGRRVAIFNAGFDWQRLLQSLDVHVPTWQSDDLDLVSDLMERSACVMLAYAPIAADWDTRWAEYRWPKLERACAQRKVETFDLRKHAALDDALATLRLIQATATLTTADVPWIGNEAGIVLRATT
ncbi:3'-5' exonuclease [Deinococcus sp. Leaf326]|uniref:3'-5' exonuclease n=1 Tax=Deinococcus sp. Leaf326 TaxID=1736338 RepID=UPI0006F5BD93|nr:3'-5' exonuclease [Deinococcus sp. Leaf326]KQR40781.1 hypothetical protein ASF71_01025 [Deinococcus sp. Leaf326]